MTNIVDMYKERWPGALCQAEKDLTEGRTAAQIYAGTTDPAMWMCSLAWVNEAKCKQTLVAVLHEAASHISTGELKSRAEGLSTSDDKTILAGHLLWLKNRLKAGTQETLDHSFGSVCKLLRGVSVDSGKVALQITNDLIGALEVLRGVDRDTAVADLYTLLRSEVDVATWAGEYF